MLFAFDRSQFLTFDERFQFEHKLSDSEANPIQKFLIDDDGCNKDVGVNVIILDKEVKDEYRAEIERGYKPYTEIEIRLQGIIDQRCLQILICFDHVLLLLIL